MFDFLLRRSRSRNRIPPQSRVKIRIRSSTVVGPTATSPFSVLRIVDLESRSLLNRVCQFIHSTLINSTIDHAFSFSILGFGYGRYRQSMGGSSPAPIPAYHTSSAMAAPTCYIQQPSPQMPQYTYPYSVYG